MPENTDGLTSWSYTVWVDTASSTITRVSQPEVQRQVRQQRADIDSLYELVERVDQKVDALDVKLDRRFDEISGQLTEVLRQLGGR